MNRYSLWHYVLLVALIIFGLIFALPSLYGEDYAVQITANDSKVVSQAVEDQVKKTLKDHQLPYLALSKEDGNLLVRFSDSETQLKAQSTIKTALGEGYSVALNLAPKTPAWLSAIGAAPLKLGLDLRGGVHFLLDVDTQALVKARKVADIRDMGKTLRESRIRYAGITRSQADTITIRFSNQADRDQAKKLLYNKFSNYQFTDATQEDTPLLNATFKPEALQKIQSYAIAQNMAILNKRVNELGVSEAVIQQQGSHQISVDLPGVQDTARAKSLIGKAATLRFQLVDPQHDVNSVINGQIPPGTRLYYYEGHPILLKNEIILRGSDITYAAAGFGEDGRPNVSIRLGSGESHFNRITAENIGQSLAVIFVETHIKKQNTDGKETRTRKNTEKIISVARINSALGGSFQIMGLDSPQYAQNLALLLRSGALAAPMEFVQERVVGPSLGKANIEKGILSIAVGSLLVIIFMALYYQVFGLIADVALVLNVVFIVAVLSLLGATLTLPGIAGIVLTVGMAVDANVLINERIREELRNKASTQSAIFSGYQKAFITIVDSNVTTLIVVIVLFTLSSSSVKGFAVTVMVGLITSMMTAIFFTRALVNLIYGNKPNKRLRIGKITVNTRRGH